MYVGAGVRYMLDGAEACGMVSECQMACQDRRRPEEDSRLTLNNWSGVTSRATVSRRRGRGPIKD